MFWTIISWNIQLFSVSALWRNEWLRDTSSYQFLIFSQTHSSIYLHSISCDSSYHITTKQNKVTPMLSVWQSFSVLQMLYSPLPPQIVSYLVIAEQFKFCFISLKHFVPKHLKLIKLFFCTPWMWSEISFAKSLMQITAILYCEDVNKSSGS